MDVKANTVTIAKRAGRSLITWEWTKRLLHWLIISAGTMSELAFLVASLWMSVNASVHALVLLFISDTMAQHLTEFATAAYVALPELILGLAFVTTIGHVRLWLYSDRKDYTPLIWAGLYGLPTVIFLLLSLITLGCSVMSVNFRLPEPLIVIRALAGYWYAFTSLLYTQLGVPQEADRLRQKDTMLSQLRRKMEESIAELQRKAGATIELLKQENANNLAALQKKADEQIAEGQRQIEYLTAELIKANALIESGQKELAELHNANNNSDEDALQAYPQECIKWLMSGVKSVSIEAITQHTGHAKRTITNAIRTGKLQTASRNKDLILVSSLIDWLRITPPLINKDEQKTDALRVINLDAIHPEAFIQNGHNRLVS